MELILINNSKLKIMLTADEVRQYDIDRDCDGMDMRRALEPVLTRAREQCGFDASAGRVFIQLFPSREGGCEMFVTKLARDNDGNRSKGNDTSKGGKKDTCLTLSVRDTVTEEDGYFSFGRISELICACRILKNAGAGDGSSVYVSEDGVYLLCLPETEQGLPFSVASVSEFAGRESPSVMRIYIPEHCRRLVPPEKSFGDDVSFLGGL